MRYANLIKQLPNLRIPRSITGDYSETKQAARDYQIAKRELFDAFRREDLGSWLKKPIEQDNFNLPTWQDFDGIDDGIDADFIGVDKKFLYAPRAKHTSTKNLVQSTTGKHTPIKTKTTATAAASTAKPIIPTTKMTTKGLYSRRHFDRYDKGSLSHKIVVKSLVHRVGGKRKTGANFITFRE